MKFAVVDIQGYTLPEEFIPKEVSIKVWNRHGNFLFTPSYLYICLNKKNKGIANVIKNKILGIRYSYGDIAYRELDSILQEYLSDLDYVYVRAHQKYDFLQGITNLLYPATKCVITDSVCRTHQQ